MSEPLENRSPSQPAPWYGPAIAGFLLSLGGPVTGIAIRLALAKVIDISRSATLIMMLPWVIGVVLCFISLSKTTDPEMPMRGAKLAFFGIIIDMVWLVVPLVVLFL